MVKRFMLPSTTLKRKPTKNAQNEQLLLTAIEQQKATIQKLKDEIEQLKAEIQQLKKQRQE